MARPYILYAWPLSLYSGKARAYLRGKGLPFVEKEVRLWHFGRLKRKVGAKVMPVVVTPQGEWLQDTAEIIELLEQRHPRQPVLPAGPRQRISALLLEAWGDEFWVPSAMHYRWNFHENYEQLFRPEAGDHLLPLAPRFLKDRAAARAAGLMRSYLPALGVTPAQVPAIEAWTVAMLDALDAHFASLPYLFGGQPSVADYGLIGPLFAHLGRDPYPARTLIAPRRHLRDWVRRVQTPAAPAQGEFLANDEVPATLAPLLRSVFGEFWPLLEQTQAQMAVALKELAPGRRLERMLGPVDSVLGGQPFRRNAFPFSLWKAQRVLDAYAALDADQRRAVEAWAAPLGGSQAMRLAIQPRLQRVALHVEPEPARG
ncbi:MAG TPA: glutathione S-transferase family protein [Candidatus Binatia bacterium]|nr:glutathione S-transferase family protein [Candidatus Binatia bacterium]